LTKLRTTSSAELFRAGSVERLTATLSLMMPLNSL
jgi:hypothetical protein